MIPRIIHAAWKDKSVLSNPSPMIVHGWKRLVDMNPTWQFQLSDDKEVDDYLQEKMSSDDYALIEHEGIVAKTDIWRLYKMYFEGGIYVDIDRYCDVRLDDVIPEGVKQILPTCREYDFSHDLMISDPGNPFFAIAVDVYLSRRRQGHKDIYFLGAQTYMHAITFGTFRQVINTNPGAENFLAIRKALDALGYIQTYREDPPHQTFLYRGSDAPRDLETLKRSFYKDHGLRHWTGSW